MRYMESQLEGSPQDIEERIALTRERDALDVAAGRRRPESLHFIPPDMVRACRVVFPERYWKVEAADE